MRIVPMCRFWIRGVRGRRRCTLGGIRGVLMGWRGEGRRWRMGDRRRDQGGWRRAVRSLSPPSLLSFSSQPLSCLFPPFSSTVRLANPLSADDSTLLLWDLTSTTPNPPSASRSAPTSPKVLRDPAFSYTAPGEINAVAWGGGGEWVAAGCGRLVRCLR